MQTNNLAVKIPLLSAIKEWGPLALCLVFFMAVPLPFGRNRDYMLLFVLIYFFVMFLYKGEMKENKPFVVMYLLLSFSFSYLHLSFNIEYPRASLEGSLNRTVDGPWRYRILIPEIINLFSLAFKTIPLDGYQIIFRFLSLNILVITTISLLRFFFNADQIQLTSSKEVKREYANPQNGLFNLIPLFYFILIPFSWDILYITDFVEIALNSLFLYFIVQRRIKLSLLFYILALLNRDSVLFQLPFVFCLFCIGHNPNQQGIKSIYQQVAQNLRSQRNILMFIISLIPLSLLIKYGIMILYGNAKFFEVQYLYNYQNFSDYWNDFFTFTESHPLVLKGMTFMGCLYILLILFWKRIDFVLRYPTLICVLLFLPFYFYAAAFHETRVFYFLFPNLILCITSIITNNQPNPSLTSPKKHLS